LRLDPGGQCCDDRRYDVLGGSKDIPGSETQDAVALENQIVLLASILAERIPIGVVSLTVEFDDELDVGIDKVNSSDPTTTPFGDVDLWGRQVDSRSSHDSDELIFELALSEVGPAKSIGQDDSHRPDAVATPAGDPVENRRHFLIGCEPDPNRLSEASFSHTLAPGYPNINQTSSN
jgi:hypothetical protein